MTLNPKHPEKPYFLGKAMRSSRYLDDQGLLPDGTYMCLDGKARTGDWEKARRPGFKKEGRGTPPKFPKDFSSPKSPAGLGTGVLGFQGVSVFFPYIRRDGVELKVSPETHKRVNLNTRPPHLGVEGEPRRPQLAHRMGGGRPNGPTGEEEVREGGVPRTSVEPCT